jgi:hypothetical protein
VRWGISICGEQDPEATSIPPAVDDSAALVQAVHPENYLEGPVLDAEASAAGMSVVITTAGQLALGSHRGLHYRRRVRAGQRRDSPPTAKRRLSEVGSRVAKP